LGDGFSVGDGRNGTGGGEQGSSPLVLEPPSRCSTMRDRGGGGGSSVSKGRCRSLKADAVRLGVVLGRGSHGGGRRH
jgi:hypothetical protein